MEGILIVILIVIVILVLRKVFWSGVQSARYNSGVTLDDKNQPLYELQVVAEGVKFKGFSISSRGEGKLFVTRDRLLFTNPNGKQVALNILLDQIINLDILPSSFGGVFAQTVGSPRLMVRYTDKDHEHQITFCFQTGSSPFGPSEDKLKKEFEEFIVNVETIKNKTSSDAHQHN